MFAEMAGTDNTPRSFESLQSLALVRAPLGAGSSSSPPDSFELEILTWFRWDTAMPKEFQQETVTLDWDWSSMYCREEAANPFAGKEGEVFLTVLKSGSRGNRLMHTFDYHSDHVPVSSLTDHERAVLAQFAEGLSEDRVSETIFPPADYGCDCHETAICSTVPNVGYAGCVCPARHEWILNDERVLTCSQPRYFLFTQIEEIVPGSRVLNLGNVPTLDAWARGTTGAVRWKGQSGLGPLELHIIPVDAHRQPIDEPLVFTLTEEQVARGAKDVPLPLSFAPHAESALVAFASPAAMDVGPQGYARYLAVAPRFQLTGVGCVGDNEKHGECVSVSNCDASKVLRANDGEGSCGSIETVGEGSTVCCVPRTTSLFTYDEPPSTPGFIFPSSYVQVGTPFFYAGQTITLQLRVKLGSPYTLYELGLTDDLSLVGPYWLRDLQEGHPEAIRELASDNAPTDPLVDITYKIAPFYGVQPTVTTVPTTTTTLVLEYVVDDEPVLELLDFDVIFPLCRGNSFLGISFDSSDWAATSVDKYTENIAGQCMSAQACESIRSAELVNQGEWALGDVNDECGADLGEDAVCCRVNGKVANDGFRQAVGDEGEGGLSTAAIAGIVAGALCVVAACVAVVCSVGLLAHRRRRKPVALSPPSTYTAASGSSRHMQRSNRGSRRNSRRF
jgi:hypothetical protein